MITSAIVSSESSVKNFFVFKRSYVPFSRYSIFLHFNHLMIYQICDVMMSISTWDRVYFRKYFLNHSWLSHQTWSIDWYKPGKLFSEIFWTIWRSGDKFQILFSLVTCCNYWVATYVKSLMFHIFAKVSKVHLKMGNFNC